MNQAELSGFIAPIILSYLNNTGNLTGSFYPLFGNPSDFATSGDYISQIDLDSAIYQSLSYISSQYAKKSGVITSGNLQNIFLNYQIDLSGKQFSGVWSGQSWSITSGLSISGTLNVNPVLESNTRTLGNDSLYIFTGTVTSDWTLPLINTCAGRQYTIKNRGSIVHLHSSGSDLIFTNTTGTFLRFVVGDACSLINDGQYWSVINFSSGRYQPQFVDLAILDVNGDVLLDPNGDPIIGL